jgi:hypothetical protein
MYGSTLAGQLGSTRLEEAQRHSGTSGRGWWERAGYEQARGNDVLVDLRSIASQTAR